VSPRVYILIAAGLLAVTGLIAVVAGVSISTDGIIIDDVACGNALGVLDTPPPGAPANWRTLCEDAVGTRQVWAWGALAVGLIGAVVALAIPTRRTDSATPPASQP
jgi:hypothetical protein